MPRPLPRLKAGGGEEAVEAVWRQRLSRAVVLVAGLWALAAAPPALPAVRESSFLEPATTRYHATASCYDRADWAALVSSGYPNLSGNETSVYGLWRYEIRQVALPTRGCQALERWRQTPALMVSVWIFVLGHELTHAQQGDFYNAPWSRPFDEVEADCGGFAKFQRIKLELGITRRLRPPPRDFARCPLKKAKARLTNGAWSAP